MKVTKRPTLVVEVLEPRLVPATIRFDGANLYIYNPKIQSGASTVTVTQGTGSAFDVQDGGADDGTYAVTGSIAIQGNNAQDNIGVSPTATTGLTGNLAITTGSGFARIFVDGKSRDGLIAGNTAVSLGAGGGDVGLGTGLGLTATGSVTLRNYGTLPATLNVGNATSASTFAGNIYAGNFSTVNLGDQSASHFGGDTYRGDVTVQNTNDPQNTTVSLGSTSTIRGDLTVLGGTLTNAVTVNGNVAGNVAVTLPGSANSLTVAGDSKNTTIGGSVLYNSSNGTNVFGDATAGDSAAINGGVTLNWGNGANSLGFTTGMSINKGFTVFDGSGGFDGGTSTIAGAFTSNAFQATVLGNIALNLGSGPNTFVFDGTNGATVGGTFNLNGGNGGNTVAVTNAPAGPAQLINVNLSLGNSGANVFWLGSADGTTPPVANTVQGTVNFGPPSTASTLAPTTPFNPGDNYFAPNGYVWPTPATLINVPS